MIKVNGKKISDDIKSDLKRRVSDLDFKPVLTVVSISQDDVGQSFVGAKKKFGEGVGVEVKELEFESNEDPEVVRLSIRAEVDKVDGMVVQLPIPEKFNPREVLNLVPLGKDPDVLNSFSRDAFDRCKSDITPPVAAAVGEILERHDITYRGKKNVVVGDGKLVGRPVSVWLRCHGALPKTLDKDDDIMDDVSEADILVSGVGKPGIIKPEMIKEGVVLIDAGTSGQSGEVLGDIDPACADKASLYTPVPGGVGPITVAKLFENFIRLLEDNR